MCHCSQDSGSIHLRERRHGSRRDAAHVRVVSAGGHEEGDASRDEDWRDDCDVGQVAAARELGVIRHEDVPFLQVACPVAQLVFN